MSRSGTRIAIGIMMIATSPRLTFFFSTPQPKSRTPYAFLLNKNAKSETYISRRT